MTMKDKKEEIRPEKSKIPHSEILRDVYIQLDITLEITSAYERNYPLKQLNEIT